MSLENKAFGYVRVSTVKQKAAETYQYQERAIRDYAKEINIEIVDVFNDKGISGIETDREEFNKMMDRINEVKHVIFFDWSRISRNMLFSNYLLYEFNKIGTVLHDVSRKEILRIDDDASLLMQQIYSFVASQERLRIKAKQKAAIKNFLAINGYWGQKERVFTKKEIDDYLKYRKLGLSKVKIALILKVSRSILYKNIKLFDLEPKLIKLKVNEQRENKKGKVD